MAAACRLSYTNRNGNNKFSFQWGKKAYEIKTKIKFHKSNHCLYSQATYVRDWMDKKKLKKIHFTSMIRNQTYHSQIKSSIRKQLTHAYPSLFVNNKISSSTCTTNYSNKTTTNKIGKVLYFHARIVRGINF